MLYLAWSPSPTHLKVSAFCNDMAYYSQRAILEQKRMKPPGICHGFANYQNSLFALEENANARALAFFQTA